MSQARYIDPEPVQTVPNSLKEQIDRASRLLAQSEEMESDGNTSLAMVKAREGLRAIQALATASPKDATLLLAAHMGYSSMETQRTVRTDSYQIVERKVLGITLWTEVVNLPTITTHTEETRLKKESPPITKEYLRALLDL